jgi:hypothetical protein
VKGGGRGGKKVTTESQCEWGKELGAGRACHSTQGSVRVGTGASRGWQSTLLQAIAGRLERWAGSVKQGEGMQLGEWGAGPCMQVLQLRLLAGQASSCTGLARGGARRDHKKPV